MAENKPAFWCFLELLEAKDCALLRQNLPAQTFFKIIHPKDIRYQFL